VLRAVHADEGAHPVVCVHAEVVLALHKHSSAHDSI
jgi:hypothetical protein